MASNDGQVHRRLDPWMEPIEAYRRLKAFSPLLLDGQGGHPEARHGILALAPAWEARFDGKAWTAEGIEVPDAGPVDVLRALVAAGRRDVGPRGMFTGGIVGMLGYEFAHALEPTIPWRQADTPDAVLRCCQDAIVFDRHERSITLWGLGPEAEARLDAYTAALAVPATRSPAPRTGTWTSSLDEAAFQEAVRTLKAHVVHGDLFQANLATRFRASCEADPADLFEALAAHNPSPYMALLDWGDHTVVSCSPEQLLATQDGVLRARPIAGTRPRGATADEDDALEAELLADPKERAEHTMLVDLVRNDVAKVCAPGTTHVPEAFSVERYRHVMHLVSRVEGTLRPGTDVVDRLSALFPAGTITGAPKHRACLRIHEAEPVARGPYTGSAGWIDWHGDAHWNILIRTLVLQDGHATVHAGAGIVADSDPAREWSESNHKAQALLDAATGRVDGGNREGLGSVRAHGSWSPSPPPTTVAARVLLIDNHDSFVHNLADAVAMLGAEARVVRNDVPLDDALAWRPTHVILGPGPGWPEDAGATWDAARTLVGRLPVLGVCLGHQALAAAHGGTVRVGPTVHGKTDAIHHDGDLMADLPSPFQATRYHSLIVDAPPGWRVTARLEDGTIMAMRHPQHPAWGVQFHPESFCTEGGLHVLRRFLE